MRRGASLWVEVVAVACATSSLVACTALRTPLPERSYPKPRLTARGTELGRCSWYGPGFHGQRTASGEVFDQNALTAAHRTLPLGTRIEVTDLASRRTVRVRVNDRGPYNPDRVLDLSYAAAKQIGMIGRGVIDVEIRVLEARGYSGVHYVVQLGAYHDATEAERSARRAREHGLKARVERSQVKPPLYRVHVGPFAERAEAAATAHRLRERGFKPVIIEIAPQAARAT